MINIRNLSASAVNPFRNTALIRAARIANFSQKAVPSRHGPPQAPRVIRPRAAPKKTTPITPTITSKTRSKVPIVVFGLAVYALSTYGAIIYFSLRKSGAEDTTTVPINADEQEDISSVYDRISKDYDSLIRRDELFMGMPLLRRALAKRAKGDVLETSAGTGRNIKYFHPKQCNSITMVDISEPMLEQAKHTFHRYHPKFGAVNFVVQDAADPIQQPPDGGFDTIIQSMGLCSHKSPIKLLRNLAAVCKPDGKIILLEHGRSHYDWLNRALDGAARDHAKEWGCWWNRDIEKILQESGLEVRKVSRYHFGTTWWIELSPKQQK